MTYIELKDELLDNARTQEEADEIHKMSKSELVALLNKSNNQNGFTLAEFMVCLAIVAVLLAVFIPNFKKYQEKARMAQVKSQEQQTPKSNHKVVCIEGYKFVETSVGVTQIIDSTGTGVPCN